MQASTKFSSSVLQSDIFDGIGQDYINSILIFFLMLSFFTCFELKYHHKNIRNYDRHILKCTSLSEMEKM